MERIVYQYTVGKEDDKPFMQKNQIGSTCYVRESYVRYEWTGDVWAPMGGGAGSMTNIVGTATVAFIDSVTGVTPVNDLWITSTGGSLPTDSGGLTTVTYAAGDGALKNAAGGWTNVGPIRGPEGPTGTAGLDGVDGTDGAQGPIGPTGSQGLQGNKGIASIIQGSDTYANILLKPAIESHIWISTTTNASPPVAVGDGLQSDGTVWINIGQIKGDQGIQGPVGPQGPQGIQGIQGTPGTTGSTGATGPQGVQGEGVPAGGAVGQVLAKVTSVDYATDWVDNIVVNDLTTGGTTDSLSAEQGKALELSKVASTTGPSGQAQTSVIVTMTQAEYDALGAPRPTSSMYIIVG